VCGGSFPSFWAGTQSVHFQPPVAVAIPNALNGATRGYSCRSRPAPSA
jgi:hypothetical protein